MTDSHRKSGRGRSTLKTAARAGSIIVASGLIAGVALAKDEKKSKDDNKKSTMAAKTTPASTMAVKTAPGGTMAWKVAPNSTMAVKTAPGSTAAVKTAPNKDGDRKP